MCFFAWLVALFVRCTIYKVDWCNCLRFKIRLIRSGKRRNVESVVDACWKVEWVKFFGKVTRCAHSRDSTSSYCHCSCPNKLCRYLNYHNILLVVRRGSAGMSSVWTRNSTTINYRCILWRRELWHLMDAANSNVVTPVCGCWYKMYVYVSCKAFIDRTQASSISLKFTVCYSLLLIPSRPFG